MEALERAFSRIGSRVRFGTPRVSMNRQFDSWTGRSERIVSDPGVTVNIGRDKRGEFFQLDAKASVELKVLNMVKDSRHLLLIAIGEKGEKYRYLCGHDERGWFAAAIPEPVSSVMDAMEALKPESIKQAQRGLGTKRRNRRKNRVFLRQGEWYFVPEPGLNPDPKLVLRNEPIRRGRGSPHMVEEVYRTGGENVYVCNRHPGGLLEDEYRMILKNDPRAGRWGWTRMRRNMTVFGRGKVTHRDHRPVTLEGWHRVLPNRESDAWFVETLLFVD